MSTPRPKPSRPDPDAAIHESPNIAFLAKHNPLLFRYGIQAERLTSAILIHGLIWPAR